MKKVITALLTLILGVILFFTLFTIGHRNPQPYLNLSGYQAPEDMKINSQYYLEGTIECNDIVKSAGIRIKDVESNTYEISKTLNNHDEEFNLSRINEYVDFSKLSKGEKTIEVIAVRYNYVEVVQKDNFTILE